MPSSHLRPELAQRQILRQNLHQIQLARLLEVPVDEIEKHIEQEVEKNPALEMEEGLHVGDGSSDGDGTYFEMPEGPILTRYSYSSEPPENGSPAEPFTSGQEAPEEYYGPYNYKAPQSLYDTLCEQLAGLDLSPRERAIAEYLIGNLNSRGYLEEPLPKLARFLSSDPAFAENSPSVEEIESVLQKIQQLEPPGIGARSQQESFILQAQALPPDTPYRDQLLRLLKEDYELLSKMETDSICKKHKLSQSELRQILQLMTRFSLSPANSLSDEVAQQVTPDFILYMEGDVLRVELARPRPIRLRINSQYRKLLEEYVNKRNLDSDKAKTIQRIKELLENAERFLELLKQREQTLLRTAREIVRHQRLFFLQGCNKQYLRPLILQDIAKATKLDVSTISRVVSRKYIQTPCGIFLLKEFFSEGLPTKSGRKISNKAIKSLLEEIIKQEDPTTPYSDEQLVQLLQGRHGIQIKRRTVAKYREQLGIPPARERRRLPLR